LDVTTWKRRVRVVVGAGAMALALASIDARRVRSQEDDQVQAAGSDEAGQEETTPTGAGAAPITAPAAAPPTSPVTTPPPADPVQRKAWLAAELTAAIARHPELGGARIGVALVDVDSGDLLWSRDPDGAYSLASCTKLLTSSAALARLGAGFRWRTSVYAEQLDPVTGVVTGDLYVRGRGDPTLDDAALRELAVDLRRAGVRRITGKLVIDDSYFDGVVDPPHYADQPKERAGYRAPIGGFGVDDNAVTVVIEPDPAGSALAAVHLDPPAGRYVQLKEATVVTVAEGRTRIRVVTRAVHHSPTHLELTVTGQIRADDGVRHVRRRVDDPARFAGEAFRAALRAEGLTIGTRLVRGRLPRAARELAAHDSPPLGDVLRGMDKYSNNFYADTLLKTMGAEARAAAMPPPPPAPPPTDPDAPPLLPPPAPPATWDDGLAVVRAFLTGEVGLAAGSFRIENGSGLYDASALSPRALTRVLRHAAADFRYGPDLIAALPIGGVDGTLRRRFAGTVAAGRVRAKTGTLAEVSTLAGLLAVDGRRPIAFAVLVNDVPRRARHGARALEDELAEIGVVYAAPVTGP
jgi:serine-type D-Ala-D-Ala carboxypeptidase/endopeptidase (penicillin-binding protein 4)